MKIKKISEFSLFEFVSNQLTGFYMMATLEFNELINQKWAYEELVIFHVAEWDDQNK